MGITTWDGLLMMSILGMTTWDGFPMSILGNDNLGWFSSMILIIPMSSPDYGLHSSQKLDSNQ
eukprot:284024-Amphidinium_carterae.1